MQYELPTTLIFPFFLNLLLFLFTQNVAFMCLHRLFWFLVPLVFDVHDSPRVRRMPLPPSAGSLLRKPHTSCHLCCKKCHEREIPYPGMCCSELHSDQIAELKLAPNPYVPKYKYAKKNLTDLDTCRIDVICCGLVSCQGTMCDDCCVATCCGICAWCQMARELKFRRQPQVFVNQSVNLSYPTPAITSYQPIVNQSYQPPPINPDYQPLQPNNPPVYAQPSKSAESHGPYPAV